MSNIKPYRKTEMMALSPMVLERSLSAATPNCRPGLNLAYSAAQDSLPHDGVAGFSLRSNKRAINCATPERELKFATPYAMPQPNDVVMIDRNGGIRLSDAPNSTQVNAAAGRGRGRDYDICYEAMRL